MSSYSNGNLIYSVDMMFIFLKEHEHAYSVIPINYFEHIFSQTCWGDPRGFKYSPNDVLASPEKYQRDYNRIINADLSYPIIISKNSNDKYIIIDGVHRLSLCLLNHNDFINAYMFDDTLLEKFMINNEGNWDYVDSMDQLFITGLYNERFKKNELLLR
jgi:hypothetical protein